MDVFELYRQGGIRLAQRLFVGGDIRGDYRQVARRREFAQVEDQRADDVVAWMARQPKGQGRKLFEDALENGVTAPGPLKAFFDEVNAKPHWVDDERLERGAKAITRAGLLGLFPLGDMSLMGGYLASRATKSLVGTGEIEYQATRRLVETATWWIDVTTPGALKHGEKGYAAALRIRLVHAHVCVALFRRVVWVFVVWVWLVFLVL